MPGAAQPSERVKLTYLKDGSTVDEKGNLSHF